jgi:hypothetical protein
LVFSETTLSMSMISNPSSPGFNSTAARLPLYAMVSGCVTSTGLPAATWLVSGANGRARIRSRRCVVVISDLPYVHSSEAAENCLALIALLIRCALAAATFAAFELQPQFLARCYAASGLADWVPSWPESDRWVVPLIAYCESAARAKT